MKKIVARNVQVTMSNNKIETIDGKDFNEYVKEKGVKNNLKTIKQINKKLTKLKPKINEFLSDYKTRKKLAKKGYKLKNSLLDQFLGNVGVEKINYGK